MTEKDTQGEQNRNEFIRKLADLKRRADNRKKKKKRK